MVIHTTDFEYEVLQLINSSKKQLSYIDVLNAFRTSNRDGDANHVLRLFLADGTLENASHAYRPPRCKLRLSDKAVLLLLEEQERREKLELVQKENERKEKQKQQAAEKKERDRLAREDSRKEADRKAEHKFQYKLTFLNAFLNFSLSFLAGLLVEHFTGIVGLVIKLFT